MRAELSIFQRLLLLVAGAGLVIAIVSGVSHHFFTARLMKQSVQGEMETALRASVDYFERTYLIPAASDIRLLESSPLVDSLLMSSGEDELFARPEAERLFLAVIRSKGDLHTSIRLVDADASERVVVVGNRRLRDYHNILETPADGHMADLYRRLRREKPGSILLEGPFADAAGAQAFLVGITKREPEIGGFGGAIIAQFDLAEYLRYLSQVRVFDSSLIWLFDRSGTLLLRPQPKSGSLDPRPFLFAGATAPDDAIVLSEDVAAGQPDAPLFRIAVALAGSDLTEHLRGAWYITFGVVGGTVLLAFLLAYPVAGQLSAPIRSLAQVTGRVSAGTLEARVPGKWGGELGRLVTAFNQMVASLQESMISRSHVDNILQSMSDALLVVDTQGVIKRTNPAMLNLLGYSEKALVGAHWHEVLAAAELRQTIHDRLASDGVFNGLQTSLTALDGRPIPVALSGAVLRSDAGVNEGQVFLAQDITERQRAEQLLHSQRQILEKIATGQTLSEVLDDICRKIEGMAPGAMCTVMLLDGHHLRLAAAPSVPREVAQALAVLEIGKGMGSCASAALSGGMECVSDALEDPRWEAVRTVAERFGIRSCWSVAIRSSSAQVLGTFAITGTTAMAPQAEHLQLLESAAHVAGIAIEGHLASAQLSWQATHDTLTGLFNRQEFEWHLCQALDSAREQGQEHALCYLDLDQFKVVNDTCGHVAGDELLRQLAGELSRQIRKTDTLARLGGDEFGLLISDCGAHDARRVAENARNIIAEYQFCWEGKSFAVGVSIGLVPITAGCAGIEALLSAADAACYAAKDQGRNRIHVFREEDEELSQRHGEMQWVSRIQAALDEDRFELFYQPIVPVADNAQTEALHFEILLRMRDERGELVPPGAFLPAAERYGLAARLDRWVIDRALQSIHEMGEGTQELGICSINLSGQSLADEDLARFVIGRLREQRIAADRICFEITETAAISNLTRAMHFIQALKAQGCLLALDDFGSGLSSFAYLKNLPVDFLKIDGMFVKDIVEDSVDYAMVRSINELGKEMGKRTIAEFVESDAILQHLRRIGVDYAQGYGIAHPRPLRELVRERRERLLPSLPAVMDAGT
jgi:diguanylate cyclase (GGDEF)-like protein/PAS domain S-box-containing protein